MRGTGMDGLKWWSEKLCQFLSHYRWLLDAYVIEFFTENHWSKLPLSWQHSLRGSSAATVAQLLLSSPFEKHRPAAVDKVYPLSLLAFVATAHTLSLSRTPSQQLDGGEREEEEEEGWRFSGRVSQVTGLDHIFRRHVKPKKQHEIKNLAKEVLKIAKATGCRNVIDIGSGQGHLARYLAYHCGLNVATVDAVGCHLTAAAKFDSEVERDMLKKARKSGSAVPTEASIVHIESLITPDISLEELLYQLGLNDSLSTSSPSSSSRATKTGLTSYILVGLHTCGDLGPTLLRVYSQSPRVVGLVSVGCCFMKLSCPSDTEPLLEERRKRGYPMSHWCTELLSGEISRSSQLSYEALEVACHSIDCYRDKITDSTHHVKVHCHRAVVETILRTHGLRRSQVKISRGTSRLPFPEYAAAVMEGLKLPLTELEREGERLSVQVEEAWRDVAVFFMLRLALAPCVESLVLVDRTLFLSEQGFKAELKAVFDPFISPRNFLISSLKNISVDRHNTQDFK